MVDDGGITEELGDLLRQMCNTEPKSNGPDYPCNGPMRTSSAVRFSTSPAAESRPLISETRRYGFDLGFMDTVMVLILDLWLRSLKRPL